MSEHNFDPFALSSGLPLADQDVTITKVEFRFDTSYSADACVAAITFQPDEEGLDAQEQLYSCGKGWEPLDQGASAGHTSGRNVNFNGQSNFGRFLAAAFATDGFIDEARETGLTPMNGELLNGCRFHLTAITTSTTNPSKPTEPAKEKSLIVPDAYYGRVGGEEAPAIAPATAPKAPAGAKKAAPRPGTPAAKPTATASTTAAPTSAIERKQIALVDELTAESEDLVEELRALAGEHESHENFMEAAMELPAVAASELAQQVVMSSKAGSIWATR